MRFTEINNIKTRFRGYKTVDHDYICRRMTTLQGILKNKIDIILVEMIFNS